MLRIESKPYRAPYSVVAFLADDAEQFGRLDEPGFEGGPFEAAGGTS